MPGDRANNYFQRIMRSLVVRRASAGGGLKMASMMIQSCCKNNVLISRNPNQVMLMFKESTNVHLNVLCL